MLQAGHPIRDNDRLVVVASPRDDVVGVLALVDPNGTAGEKEQVALEHGATVLAMELARLASLAETELRQRRDLVEELLAGDEEEAFNRAQSLGYDLGRPHRVVVVTGGSHNDEEETLFHAVRRAARDLEAGSLLVARAGEVVLFSDKDASWTRFQAAVDSALRGGHCRIGIGAVCERPRISPALTREAQLALKMQQAMGGGQGVTQFEDLGVYQVLSELPDIGSVERFVRSLVGTAHGPRCAQGLPAGGHAERLSGERWPLRHRRRPPGRAPQHPQYRLQQIRTVTGYDLGDADTSFNLHLAARAWRTLEAMRDP